MARPRKSIVFKRKGSPFWQYKWTVQGTVLRGSTGERDDKARATEIALKARQELSDHVLLGKAPKPPEMKVDEALHRHWLEYASHLPSARAIWTQMKALHAGLGMATLLSAIDDEKVAVYVAQRLTAPPPLVKGRGGKMRRRKGKAGRAPATVNRELVLLGQIMKRARDTWKVAIGPANVRRYMLKEDSGREVFLDRDRARQLANAIIPHARIPIAIGIMTGLRRGGFLGLDWDKHVSLSEARVTRVVKGGKILTVPLPPTAVALLAWLEPDPEKRHGPVFRFGHPRIGCPCVSCTSEKRGLIGKPMHGLRRSFNTARKSLGLGHVRIHDLRHTFASWVLQTTQNLKLGQKLLGHADLETTSKYSHLIRGGDALAVAESMGGFGEGLAEGIEASLGANKAQSARRLRKGKS